MTRSDPYDRRGPKQFECRSCSTRVAATERKAICPECGGRLRNLSVARE